MDSNYELPVAYSLTKASTSDIKEGHKMINNIKETKIEILDKLQKHLKEIADMTIQNYKELGIYMR